MRIIPNDVTTYGNNPVILLSDTIEVTDDEWNKIYRKYSQECAKRRITQADYPFYQYLRELIELMRTK
jgi:hypothetical protein